jgi:chromosome segregation ATPase
MKYIPYIIIGALIIYILLKELFPGRNIDQDVKTIKDSTEAILKQHAVKIAEFEKEKKQHLAIVSKILIEKKTDSIKSQKTIFRLYAELKKAKYTGNPSSVPDDSVQIAMQALKEAPYKDSLISAYKSEVVKLNDQITILNKEYGEILDGNQKEANEVQDQMKALVNERDSLLKIIKKLERKIKIKFIEGFILGTPVGIGIEAIAH